MANLIQAFEEAFSFHKSNDPVSWHDLRRILKPIHKHLEELRMAEIDLENAQAAEAAEVSQVEADQTQLATDVTNEIAALKAQVEAGGTVTAEQLQAAIDKSTKVTASLSAVDAAIKAEDASVTPAPTPAPSPEPTPAPEPAPEPAPTPAPEESQEEPPPAE